MKALVYHGPAKKSLESVPTPRLLEPGDALVRVTHTTICGTDLHILQGDVPEVANGRILGHEGIGIVVSTGPGVMKFHPGEHVVISCITSCGRCDYCRRGMLSHCDTGGWRLGHTIDGTQAEFVRIPHADNSLHLIPRDANDEAMVMLSDVLPTSYECGILSGELRPGQSVAVVGVGPIGLGVLLSARLYSPSDLIAIDTDDNRLEVARAFGATVIIDNKGGSAAREVMDLTKGRGVDLAVEAVGIPATFDLCQAIVAPGGRIANVGVHGHCVSLHLERLWSHNITITTRLVDTISTPELIKALSRGSLDPRRLVTHRFTLDKILNAYDIFADAAHSRSLKTIILP